LDHCPDNLLDGFSVCTLMDAIADVNVLPLPHQVDVPLPQVDGIFALLRHKLTGCAQVLPQQFHAHISLLVLGNAVKNWLQLMGKGHIRLGDKTGRLYVQLF
jgi:hypothetical protein